MKKETPLIFQMSKEKSSRPNSRFYLWLSLSWRQRRSKFMYHAAKAFWAVNCEYTTIFIHTDTGYTKTWTLMLLFLHYDIFYSARKSCGIDKQSCKMSFVHTTLWAERSFRLTVAGWRRNSSSESGTFTLITLRDLS